MVNLVEPESQQQAKSSDNLVKGFVMQMLVGRVVGAVIALIIFLILAGFIVFSILGSR